MKFVLLVSLALILTLSKAEDSIDDYCFEEQKFKEAHGEPLYNHIVNDKNDRKDKSYKKISFDSDKVYKVITYGSPETKESLIKIVEMKDAQFILTEIKRLISLKDLKVTPNYEGCLKLEDKYVIIHEKVHNDLTSSDMTEMFKNFSKIKKIFKFIQIAIVIQTLHTNKIISESIRPYHIVSVDPEMNDLRILDLSHAKEMGETVNQSNSSYNLPCDLFKVDKTHAHFRQDAYAYGITMINLLNGDESLFKNVNFKSFKIFKNYKESMTTYLDLKMSKHDFKDFTTFLKETLLVNYVSLNINTMITKLFNIFSTLPKLELKENLSDQAAELQEKSVSNSKIISGFSKSSGKFI